MSGDLSFLSSLSNCSQLELLAINENKFGGVLPDAIANFLSKFGMLYMGGNQISGSIPDTIGNLASLTALDLRSNLLTGTIPTSMEKLQQLERLLLFENNLHGDIPSFIGNLTPLFDLELYSNKFEGRIPASLMNCLKMQNLDLSDNYLSGTIPEQVLGFLRSLIDFDISYNSLSGPLPSDICNSSHLTELKAYENKLSGGIPSELVQCSDLTLLRLQGNLLSGNISFSLTALKALESLDISRNNLSGTIPQQLQDLPSLKQLNLSFNNLEGQVPMGRVFQNVSAFSVKGNNKLCGGITELKLPACSNEQQRRKKNGSAPTLIIATSITILLVAIVIMVIVSFWWRRKPRSKHVPPNFVGHSHLHISYKELLQATGGFASTSLIGVGTFGSVYKGFLHQHEKFVAVKVFNQEQRGALKSFLAECKALSKVRHRNLLKIITSCSSLDYNGNNFMALVFDFMPNGNLDSWLHVEEQDKSRNLDLMKRLDIAIDVANALDYFHNGCEAPVIHCDLKPSNVLLDNDMVAHVSDFGLAKLLPRATEKVSVDQSCSSLMMGTIGYVPPEYGLGGLISTQGDIYSYGVPLLEMVTGKRPTDAMFKAGFDLREFCMTAMPEGIRNIEDSRLLGHPDEDSYSPNERNECSREGKMLECLVSVVRIVVSCSAEVPSDRMNIKEVIKELHVAKAKLLQGITGTRIESNATTESDLVA